MLLYYTFSSDSLLALLNTLIIFFSIILIIGGISLLTLAGIVKNKETKDTSLGLLIPGIIGALLGIGVFIIMGIGCIYFVVKALRL